MVNHWEVVVDLIDFLGCTPWCALSWDSGGYHMFLAKLMHGNKYLHILLKIYCAVHVMYTGMLYVYI